MVDFIVSLIAGFIFPALVALGVFFAHFFEGRVPMLASAFLYAFLGVGLWVFFWHVKVAEGQLVSLSEEWQFYRENVFLVAAALSALISFPVLCFGYLKDKDI